MVCLWRYMEKNYTYLASASLSRKMKKSAEYWSSKHVNYKSAEVLKFGDKLCSLCLYIPWKVCLLPENYKHYCSTLLLFTYGSFLEEGKDGNSLTAWDKCEMKSLHIYLCIQVLYHCRFSLLFWRAVMKKYSNSGGPDSCAILIILKVFSNVDCSLILCKLINHFFYQLRVPSWQQFNIRVSTGK